MRKASRILCNPSELECLTNIPVSEWDRQHNKLTAKAKYHSMEFERARNTERMDYRQDVHRIEI